VSEARLLDAGNGTRLQPDAPALLEAARALGSFKMVVRNDFAVMERPGAIRDVLCGGGMLLAEATTFCCFLDAHAVRSAFAHKESVQLFDGDGVSIAKLILRPESDRAGFEALVRRLRLADPGPPADAQRTAPAFQEMPCEPLSDFLHEAAGRPLRIAVSNRHATLQADHAIRRVKRSERACWINVLDPELDLHLYEGRIRRLEAGRHWLADDGTAAFSAG
jgi:putative heme degradation protein